MLLPLGILASAGGGAAAYELISTTVLGSTATSVTFSGLGTSAANYKHLQVRGAVFTSSWIDIRFNGDTGSNYSYHELRGNGSSVSSSANAGGQTFMLTALGQSASGVTAFVTDVLDHASTSKNKTIRTLGGTTAGGNVVGLTSGVWLNTAALTSLTVEAFGLTTSFAAGSRFSLYGIRGS